MAVACTAAGALEPQWRGSIHLRPCLIPETGEEMLCGSMEVFEDRRTMTGRTLSLNIAVIPSLSPRPRPEPIFYLTGGPGGAATEDAFWLSSSWMRKHWEIVLVDQRGTGRSRPLDCKLPGSAGDVQGYLEPAFERIQVYRRCKRRLGRLANLRLYTTATSMDDLDDVRHALGYGRINLRAGSAGTRAALIYLRRHPQQVRAAILSAVAPLSFRNPLYHARAAQHAIDLIFAECAREAGCAAAFPDVEEEFAAVLERLGEAPAAVTIPHPDTGEPVTVELTRTAFAEGIRLLMYSGTRWVPYLIHLAYREVYEPITEYAVGISRTLREILSYGMLLSVICAEDAPRIDPAEVQELTEGTFLGDGRVRRQLAICEIWPTLELPPSYADPVVSDVPVLLLSGTVDPVTPPEFGAEAARHLANGHHLVVPGPHSIGGPCLDAISLRFMRRGTMTGVNTRCAEHVRLPPFELPD